MDDISELIALAKSGNDAAFETLCIKYSGLINSMSAKYSNMCPPDVSQHEDFQQEAKMAFYKAVVNYDGGEKGVVFGAYAKVCIRNRLVSCIRVLTSKKRRREDAEEKYDDGLQENVLTHELGEQMKEAARNLLSPYEKKVFTLYATGRKAKEISAVLGKSKKSVDNTIYRIKSKLKRTIKKDT